MRRRALFLAIAIFTMTTSAYAADDPETLFAEGSALMDQSKFQEALRKFERAQKLDAGVGTQFNIAVCHQNLGHLAVAYRNFVEVQRLAHASGKKVREDLAAQKAADLKPRLSYFVIRSEDLADVLVRVDGEIMDKTTWAFVPVDAGSHTVEASAPAKVSWTTDLAAPAAGQHADVIVPALKTAEGKTITLTKETSNPRRTAAFVVGGVGAAGIVVGAITGAMILSAKSTADDHCKSGTDKHCLDSTGKLDTTGTDAVSRGKTLVPINYVAFGVGVVGLGVGAYLMLTSSGKSEEPSPSTSTSPKAAFTPLPGGGFLGVSGSL